MVGATACGYSILIHSKLTELFGIENFSGAKGAGKVLIIIIIYYFIIIIIFLCHSTISLAVSQRNQEKEKTCQYI